jgi:hypothetical protein
MNIIPITKFHSPITPDPIQKPFLPNLFLIRIQTKYAYKIKPIKNKKIKSQNIKPTD